MVSSLFRAERKKPKHCNLRKQPDPLSGSLSRKMVPVPFRLTWGVLLWVAQMMPWLDRSVGMIGDFACGWGESQMKLAFQLLACWLVVSCAVGPLFTWAFFWGERVARDEAAPADTVASLELADAHAS